MTLSDRVAALEAENVRLREALTTIGKAVDEAYCWPPQRRDKTLEGIAKVVERVLK